MVVALYVDGMTDAQAMQSPHSDAALIYSKVCVCVHTVRISLCVLCPLLFCVLRLYIHF